MDRNTVEKRRAYRRKKAKKRRLIVGFIFFGLVVLSITVALTLTVLFPVKKIDYIGNKVYSDEQLAENLNIKGKNIFVLSEKTVTEDARKKLPYIKDVGISKKFPDAVSVKITEAKDFAAYQVGSVYYMISEDGYVLAEKQTKPENVIEIRAREVKQTVGEKVDYSDDTSREVVETIINNLKKNNIKIDYIDVKSATDINSGIMNGRFKVVFGTKLNIDKKTDHLCEMIKSIDGAEKGTINLSLWSESDPVGRFIKE
ncbi:MAG TPA: hypothetical protein DEW35_00290 [Ruminococcaceae bacterium]|nr:hypothetical protein [Oscillospiraceae bacterium]